VKLDFRILQDRIAAIAQVWPASTEDIFQTGLESVALVPFGGR